MVDREEVEAMLMASIVHAKEDIQTRSIVEASTEAEQLIQLTETFLTKHAQFITETEKQSTHEAIHHLRSAINDKHKDKILHATEQLNHLTRPYAERVMDVAIGEALKGKGI